MTTFISYRIMSFKAKTIRTGVVSGAGAVLPGEDTVRLGALAASPETKKTTHDFNLLLISMIRKYCGLK